jgi:hypothetical protein
MRRGKKTLQKENGWQGGEKKTTRGTETSSNTVRRKRESVTGGRQEQEGRCKEERRTLDATQALSLGTKGRGT